MKKKKQSATVCDEKRVGRSKGTPGKNREKKMEGSFCLRREGRGGLGGGG